MAIQSTSMMCQIPKKSILSMHSDMFPLVWNWHKNKCNNSHNIFRVMWQIFPNLIENFLAQRFLPKVLWWNYKLNCFPIYFLRTDDVEMMQSVVSCAHWLQKTAMVILKLKCDIIGAQLQLNCILLSPLLCGYCILCLRGVTILLQGSRIHIN